MNSAIQHIQQLFEERGSSLYGGEAVTQLEHALQAGMLAEQNGESKTVITAAFLHDLGHLLHDLPEDAPDEGIDDLHEELAWKWLSDYFGPEVSEPVRLHVAAKRYLCAIEPNYRNTLSPPSQQSLDLQGGPFTDEEVREFECKPYFEVAVRLRHWDDEAKIVGLETPSLEYFLQIAEQSLVRPAYVEHSK